MSIILILALAADPWADSSPFVQYGEGAGYGQSYYPENILGPPAPDATPQSPAAGEDELLTLGEDGIVVVEFTDNTVINGEGPDFTVFENVMDTGAGYFRECAFVEVSQDGQTWAMFPYDTGTLEGLAGVWPTTGDDPTDPDVSGGDQFDLEVLELDWVRFVRLTDCGSQVNDGGLFDLDAVAAVNWTTGITQESEASTPLLISSPFSTSFSVTAGEPGILRCYSADGRLVAEWSVTRGTCSLQSMALPSGVLLFQMENRSFTAVKLNN